VNSILKMQTNQICSDDPVGHTHTKLDDAKHNLVVGIVLLAFGAHRNSAAHRTRAL